MAVSTAFFSGADAAQGLEHLLDDPQEWRAFGKPLKSADMSADMSAGMSADMSAPQAEPAQWESQVVLQGMHCAACALTIEDALRQVPGVEHAHVSAATQRARVVWNSQQVLPSQWMNAVQKAGYQALPAMDSIAREQRQREHRRALWRWLVAGFCMMQVMMYAWPAYQAKPGDLSMEMEQLLRWASWVISLPVVLFACGPFFSSAWRDVRERRVSMDLPVALGMLITFVVSMLGTFDPAGPFGHEVYYDSLTMFVFFLLTGRWLELRLRDRTAGALETVMNRLPDSVLRQTPDKQWERVAIRRLALGDVVQIQPGEAFPADGRIIEGHTQADEALLTGESTPVAKPLGAEVTAGSYNLRASVQVLITHLGEHTRFGQIVALMESAALQKPRLAQLADKVARPFLLAVLLAAGLAALWWWQIDPSRALMVAVAVLIVTCPCALSLATPVAMLTAAGNLARSSVLVRQLQGLEALASVDTVVFDKTGTLTRDALQLRRVQVQADSGLSEDEALALAAALAQHSLHPVSRALVSFAQHQNLAASTAVLTDVQEIAGAGLQAQWHAPSGLVDTLLLGSVKFAGVAPFDALEQQVILSLDTAAGRRELARFFWMEQLRPEAKTVVQALQSLGVAVQLLSGDRTLAVQRIAQQAGVAQARGDCTPQDKLDHLRALQMQGKQVAMIGDGLNDGPVLAGAHVSFAFGRSVPLAQSRSDFVVIGDNLHLLVKTLRLARRTMRVVRQNLGWAAAYNAVGVPLAIAGYMPAWLAGLGMAGSSLLVVLNAARLVRAEHDDLPTLPGATSESAGVVSAEMA